MAEIEFLPPPAAPSEAPERVEPRPASAPTSTGDGVQPTARASSPHELLPDELAQAHRIFANEGATPPDPANSILVGTLSPDGSLSSFLGIQPMVHIDPLWISPGAEHELRGLVACAEQAIRSRLAPGSACKVFVFAPDGRVARMAELNQMQREGWTVYSKVVQAPPTESATAPDQIRRERVLQPEPSSPPVLDDSYQARGDDSAWESLFPNGVLSVDPSGRIQ